MTEFALARAFLRRDWLNESSYRATLLIQALGVASSLILFYSIGKLVEGSPESLREYGGEYFPFALVGLAVSGYFSVALQSFSGRLRQAQQTGTLEAMLVTATPASTILVLGGAWDFVVATLRFLVFVAVGLLLMGVDFEVNAAAVVVVGLLSLVAFIALGLLLAAAVLVIKRGESLATVGNIVATVFGGVLFPIALIPEWARPLSYLVPLSYALDGLRKAALTGAGLEDIGQSLVGLVLSVLVLVPAAWMGMRWALTIARRDGTLGQY